MLMAAERLCPKPRSGRAHLPRVERPVMCWPPAARAARRACSSVGASELEIACQPTHEDGTPVNIRFD